jgi:hypothetical protein
MNRMSARSLTVTGAAVLLLGMAGAVPASAAGPGAGCQPAGTSGFTAKVVAKAGQHISGWTVDATGCDVGIYVADQASHVTISRVTVTGANGAGILVENTSDIVVERSIVHDNGLNVPPPPPPIGPPEGTGEGEYTGPRLPQAFGISLFGVSHAVVTRNMVYDNGRGGIGVMDTGPFDPGHLIAADGTPVGSSPSTPVPVRDVVVSRNTLWGNLNGCAVVVSVFNTGNHISDVTVTRNTITGTGFGATGPDVGGIVAQTNGGNSMVKNITISRNTIVDSGESGVIVHAAAPGSHTVNVQVVRNMLSGNNQLNEETGHTTGVVVSSWLAGADLGQSNINTRIERNTMTDQFYGVWTQGPNPPTLVRNAITVTAGGTPFFVAPTS